MGSVGKGPSIPEAPQTDTRGRYCSLSSLSAGFDSSSCPLCPLSWELKRVASCHTFMCNYKLISPLSLTRHNLEGASVFLWCVIQARRVKCKACLSKSIGNSKGVWMCWSTTPMPESQYSLNLDSSSTFLTSPSDPGMLVPTHRPFHYPALHAFLPSDCPTHHISCAFQALMKNIKKPFWEAPASIWDDINNVGLR